MGRYRAPLLIEGPNGVSWGHCSLAPQYSTSCTRGFPYNHAANGQEYLCQVKHSGWMVFSESSCPEQNTPNKFVSFSSRLACTKFQGLEAIYTCQMGQCPQCELNLLWIRLNMCINRLGVSRGTPSAYELWVPHINLPPSFEYGLCQVVVGR